MRPPGKKFEEFSLWSLRLVALPMAQTSQVEGRLRAILLSLKRGEVARRTTLTAGAVTLLLLAGLAAARFVSKDPATLDASTPLAQGGFTLRAIQRGDGSDYWMDKYDPQGGKFQPVQFVNVGRGGVDGTDLWIQPPALPGATPDALQKEYRVLVRSSTGTAFSWPYVLLSWPAVLADNDHSASGQPPLLYVALPPGYPDSYRYFDVTVADRHGHRARWRLTNLPKMRHALAPPLALRSRFSSQGITLRAEAGHSTDPRGESVIALSLRAAASKTAAHHWEITCGQLDEEWEAENVPSDADSLASTQAYPVDLPSPASGTATRLSTPYSTVLSPAYANDMHFVGLDGNLRQYETYDEAVTFHDVVLQNQHVPGQPVYCAPSATQSVTTPSGITLTLPHQPRAGVSSDVPAHAATDAVNCDYTASVGSQATFLARSPLCRQYHLPVTVQVTVGKPYQWAGTFSDGTEAGSLAFTSPKPYPTRIANLTLIVRQRVELQTLPLHFIAPVADAPPALRSKGRAQ